MNEITAYHKLYNAGLENKDVSYTPAEFTQFVRRTLNLAHVKFKTYKTSDVDIDTVIISGEYDTDDDEEGAPAITVTISFNDNQSKVSISILDWQQVCIDIIEVIGHEMVHQQQVRSRDFDGQEILFSSGKKNKELCQRRDYLGQGDEVEAYGYSIALTAYLQGHTKEITGPVVVKNAMFKEYVTIFGTYHPVVLALFEHIIHYHAMLCGEEVETKKHQLAHLVKRL